MTNTTTTVVETLRAKFPEFSFNSLRSEKFWDNKNKKNMFRYTLTYPKSIVAIITEDQVDDINLAKTFERVLNARRAN